ncbi:MAG: sad1-interacting factor 2 [Sedimenticola sp.]|nr:MAG: sad1-interacting factor 2 [Sedimenticola sp.]
MLMVYKLKVNTMGRCISTSLAKRFSFEDLVNKLTDKYRCTRYRDALHIEDDGHIFLFRYGVMVTWDISHDCEKRIRHEIEPFCINPLPDPYFEHFNFELNADQNRISGDRICIEGSDALQLMAVSHGLAQSSKLNELESYAEQTIEETAHIPRSMAVKGRTNLSRRDISKMRGKLFLVESDINLHHALLDTPEFFWEYPEMENLYIMTAKYLDIQPRIEVLNRKLTIIHEIFGMLADEQKHKHSSLLEWIIIWLIAIEILIFLFHDLLKWF